VEPLARRLGVTKGSFYWHFPSRDALLQAALERWELFEQVQVFGSLADVTDPRVRLRQLFQVVAHEVQPHIIYSELLKALDHPMVRPVIDRVSHRRLEYLVASFRQAGLSRTDAQHRARLAYAAYVGFLQLSLQLQQPKQAREDFEAYVEHVIETLIPLGCPARDRHAEGRGNAAFSVRAVCRTRVPPQKTTAPFGAVGSDVVDQWIDQNFCEYFMYRKRPMS